MGSEQWFEEHADAVYSYILLLVRDPHAAEDLTQDTFIKVLANEKNFKGESAARTWIFRIAYTTTMSYFRANRRKKTVPDGNHFEPSAEETVLLNAQQELFYKVLKTLKPSYQQVIALRKIKGFSTRETAEILNCSEGKVKMSLSRAMGKFKEELEKGGLTDETYVRRRNF